MQLTKYTDYALRVLMYLAIQEDRTEKIQIQTIADKFGIPKNHLIKVVHRLGQEEFISTVKGKGGGIFLCRAPSTISVGQVVRRLETTLNPVNCDEPVCCIKEVCMLKPALHAAMEAFLSTLDNYTLADITQNEQKLGNLLHTGGTENFFK
ncbi:Rrf2 family transcriptional regulator [Hydrogenovibrio sp. JE_KL2]|uniref:Rrf2 family transcriptional regulator n=1 Tax=Hydrogenovibrio sp. JE_KL2 TaxID=2651188 RepID=UPI00128CC259|nr:Rrf2 family transcriptional regulator [Hydrogenovibrio sp. JE_KL2]MPQ75509.1 Rrf2 family transcriptional regulator [Hydrogenovibrio sp. JE_KL2]